MQIGCGGAVIIRFKVDVLYCCVALMSLFAWQTSQCPRLSPRTSSNQVIYGCVSAACITMKVYFSFKSKDAGFFLSAFDAWQLRDLVGVGLMGLDMVLGVSTISIWPNDHFPQSSMAIVVVVDSIYHGSLMSYEGSKCRTCLFIEIQRIFGGDNYGFFNCFSPAVCPNTLAFRMLGSGEKLKSRERYFRRLFEC